MNVRRTGSNGVVGVYVLVPLVVVGLAVLFGSPPHKYKTLYAQTTIVRSSVYRSRGTSPAAILENKPLAGW